MSRYVEGLVPYPYCMVPYQCGAILDLIQNIASHEDGDYVDLYNIIDFPAEFEYRGYYSGETDLLEPLLRELGCTHIRWSMGEYDSFGPLTRVVKFTMPDGTFMKAYYG